MPYVVVKRGDNYCIQNRDSGAIKKGRCHKTKAKAQAQARAIMAWKPKKKGKKK